MKKDLSAIRMAKRQQHYKKKKDKDNEARTKYVAPYGG